MHKNNVSYIQQSSITVTRTTHRIAFHYGETVASIIDSFKRVPLNAKLIEYDEGDSETGEWPSLTFEVEKAK